MQSDVRRHCHRQVRFAIIEKQTGNQAELARANGNQESAGFADP